MRFIYEMYQGGNMGNAWDTAKDGIMSEEDYPYEHKVLLPMSICWVVFVLIINWQYEDHDMMIFFLARTIILMSRRCLQVAILKISFLLQNQLFQYFYDFKKLHVFFEGWRVPLQQQPSCGKRYWPWIVRFNCFYERLFWILIRTGDVRCNSLVICKMN